MLLFENVDYVEMSYLWKLAQPVTIKQAQRTSFYLLIYSLTGDEYGLFKIDRKTGNVTVKGVLDREFYTKFILTIEAYEATNVKSYTRINLNIKLTDENDNKPKFEKDHYNFELNEDEINNNGLISRDIKATDEDVTVGFVYTKLKIIHFSFLFFIFGSLHMQGSVNRKD